MNKTAKPVRSFKPPRLLPVLFNPLAKTLLCSPWHGVMSRHLLLITFTGRKSGNVFTTPATYEQKGEETLLLRIGYPWWKNLRDDAAVRVHFRGKVRSATTEVLGEEGGLVVVEVHLKG